MEKMLVLLVEIVEKAAEYGTGFRSGGIMYEPEVPEDLLGDNEKGKE